jgi:hypothetical protein
MLGKKKKLSILSCARVTIDGIGLVIGLIGLLKLVTTVNYSTITDSHTLQFTTAHTKSSHSAIASTSRCLAMALNSGLCFHSYIVGSWLQFLRPCSCEMYSLTNFAVHYNRLLFTVFTSIAWQWFSISAVPLLPG